MNIFEFISVPLGYIMEGCYLLVRNFPLALFMFTVLTRLLLFPLNVKQQNSMAKTSAMQGKMEEIKKKYPDKQKQSEEMQKLYAEEKMNPLSGCLPMLIQMPILFGLIFVIYKPLTYILHVPAELIEQATAIVGANGNYTELNILSRLGEVLEQVPDLANYGVQELDLNLFGVINLGESPSFSNPSWLWMIPIASVILQILQVYISNQLNKRNGMAAPKNFLMMFIMPLIFFFFTFTVPGGVGFYWACGSLVGILQTVITSTFYSPGRIVAKNEFKLAVKRLEKEKAIKEGHLNQ